MTKPARRTPTNARPLVTASSAGYQPSARELRETLRVSVPFEDASDFLVKEVDTKIERRQNSRKDYTCRFLQRPEIPPGAPICCANVWSNYNRLLFTS